jgi:hypothetical protein
MVVALIACGSRPTPDKPEQPVEAESGRTESGQQDCSDDDAGETCEKTAEASETSGAPESPEARPDKCTLGIDKAMKMGLDMAVENLRGLNEPDMEGKLAKMKASMAEERPVAIQKCRDSLANDTDGKLERTIDCIIAAEDIEAVGKCETL